MLIACRTKAPRRGLTVTGSQYHRARRVEMHVKMGCCRRSASLWLAITGMRSAVETESEVKKYSLAVIGEVSAPASRIQVNFREQMVSEIPSNAIIFVPRFEGDPNFVEESTDYFVSILESSIDNRIVQGSALRQESTDIASGGNLAPVEIALTVSRERGYDVLVMGKVTSHKTMGSLNGFSTIRIYDVGTGDRIANFHRPSGLLVAHSEHQSVMAAVKRAAGDASKVFAR